MSPGGCVVLALALPVGFVFAVVGLELLRLLADWAESFFEGVRNLLDLIRDG